MKDTPEQDPPELTPPRRLVDGLRSEVQSLRVLVPAELDERIRQAARLKLTRGVAAGLASRGTVWRTWLPRIAAALCGAGLVGLWVNTRPPLDTSDARRDLDQSGRIDILDAFSLARQLQRQAVSGEAFDLNGDRQVDERDVQLLISQAVALDREAP